MIQCVVVMKTTSERDSLSIGGIYMDIQENNTKIIAVAGKGGVGKTSLAAVIVKLLAQAYPDKKILAIDADPAVGLSTALGIEVIKYS